MNDEILVEEKKETVGDSSTTPDSRMIRNALAIIGGGREQGRTEFSPDKLDKPSCKQLEMHGYASSNKPKPSKLFIAR